MVAYIILVIYQTIHSEVSGSRARKAFYVFSQWAFVVCRYKLLYCVDIYWSQSSHTKMSTSDLAPTLRYLEKKWDQVHLYLIATQI